MDLTKLRRTYLGWIYQPLWRRFLAYRLARFNRKETARLDNLYHELDAYAHRVFYLGITNHSNLGDMAQHYCILNWIKTNYPTYQLVKFESDTVVDDRFGFIEKLKKVYRPSDIILFQSGYCTQDLGGNHEYMHRLIIDNMPEAKILMMPQTIYFQHEENRSRTSESYNRAKHMLFLARDFVSFKDAQSMFPAIQVKAFPDIVTTLIGTMSFNKKRNGVCICCRNDGEKLYTDQQIEGLANKVRATASVVITDTTIKESYKKIRHNLKYYIEREISNYAQFEVMITDRYHGTIFSLAAGTPVIILKTTDHKVTTGADWFKGVYDDYVYVAESLDDAFDIYQRISKKPCNHKLPSYFLDNYYNKLKAYFEEAVF